MPEKVSILYAEDDKNLAFVTADNLNVRGYKVTWASDGETALQLFRKNNFDLCVLDVMMPGLDGFALASRIRESNEEIPILFLTARTMQEDKIRGLRLGADDYICKPYTLDELCLKMEVFLKRRNKTDRNETIPDAINIGRYTYRPALHTLSGPETGEINLTKRENDVLLMLAKGANSLIKREELLKKIWGNNDYFAGRSLDVFIARIRKYLKKDERVQIENVHHVGFILRC